MYTVFVILPSLMIYSGRYIYTAVMDPGWQTEGANKERTKQTVLLINIHDYVFT